MCRMCSGECGASGESLGACRETRIIGDWRMSRRKADGSPPSSQAIFGECIARLNLLSQLAVMKRPAGSVNSGSAVMHGPAID